MHDLIAYAIKLCHQLSYWWYTINAFSGVSMIPGDNEWLIQAFCYCMSNIVDMKHAATTAIAEAVKSTINTFLIILRLFIDIKL